VNFQEADRRYVEIKRRGEAGELTQEEFDEQLKQLMVQDEEGRWWVKSPTTGEWHYHDGTAWVKDTPPGYQAPQDTSEDQPEIQQPQIDQSSPPAALSRQGLYWGVGLTSLAAILLPLSSLIIAPNWGTPGQAAYPLLALIASIIIQYVGTLTLAYKYPITPGWTSGFVASIYILNLLGWLGADLVAPEREFNFTTTFAILVIACLLNVVFANSIADKRSTTSITT
jgi:hypothetical protein